MGSAAMAHRFLVLVHASRVLPALMRAQRTLRKCKRGMSVWRFDRKWRGGFALAQRRESHSRHSLYALGGPSRGPEED